eukprot:COSAG01_NODE_8307_length_2837_cov_1.861213_2_plen_552_part_00
MAATGGIEAAAGLLRRVSRKRRLLRAALLLLATLTANPDLHTFFVGSGAITAIVDFLRQRHQSDGRGEGDGGGADGGGGGGNDDAPDSPAALAYSAIANLSFPPPLEDGLPPSAAQEMLRCGALPLLLQCVAGGGGGGGGGLIGSGHRRHRRRRRQSWAAAALLNLTAHGDPELQHALIEGGIAGGVVDALQLVFEELSGEPTDALRALSGHAASRRGAHDDGLAEDGKLGALLFGCLANLTPDFAAEVHASGAREVAVAVLHAAEGGGGGHDVDSPSQQGDHSRSRSSDVQSVLVGAARAVLEALAAAAAAAAAVDRAGGGHVAPPLQAEFLLIRNDGGDEHSSRHSDAHVAVDRSAADAEVGGIRGDGRGGGAAARGYDGHHRAAATAEGARRGIDDGPRDGGRGHRGDGGGRGANRDMVGSAISHSTAVYTDPATQAAMAPLARIQPADKNADRAVAGAEAGMRPGGFVAEPRVRRRVKKLTSSSHVIGQGAAADMASQQASADVEPSSESTPDVANAVLPQVAVATSTPTPVRVRRRRHKLTKSKDG